MPKFKIVCLLLVTVLAITGTVLVVKNVTDVDIPDFEKPTEDLNTYIDRTDDMDIDDTSVDVRQHLFVAHKVLLDGEGFYGVAEGTSTAMGISQNVRNSRYVVGEFASKAVLKEMVTKGIVSKAYQLYMEGNNYIYRKGTKISSLRDVTWENTAQALSEAAFYSDFGHRNDKLTGYILNWKTVKSGELVEVKDGVYTFRYVLDPDTASTYLRREMIFNGGLNAEPKFSKCVIYVAMDRDFNVKTLRTDCEYKARTMGINADLSEDITEVFNPYLEQELPERSFFEQFFDAEPSGGIEKEQTALDVLMEMFAPYIGGEALQVAIDAKVDGESIVNGLLSIDGLDISDLSKLTVNAKIGDVDLAYEHGNGKIYLKYKDFQGSTTVEGIMELVSTLTTMFGESAAVIELPALDDFDVEGLLENLTYTVNENEVVVSLPINLGGLTIDAKLYGEVDGDTYAFAKAVVTIGGVEIGITPQTWTVAERTGEYPEILDFAEPIISLINAQGYAIGVDASVTIDGKTYGLDASLTISGGNVHVIFTLSYNGIKMFDDAEVWVLDNMLYIHAGDIKFVMELPEADTDSDFSISSLKDTLQTVKGYNDTVDVVIDLVLNLLDTQLDSLVLDEIVPHMLFKTGELTLDVDGSQFGLSSFALSIAAGDGLTLSIKDLSYKNITLNVKKANIQAYDGAINGPGVDEDFSTNLVIDIQDDNTTGEHNVIYVNIDLLKGVVLARIETEMSDGSKTSFLDIKYTFADNVLKLTNGEGVNVIVNINKIADIVDTINDIVNEFANAGDQALPDLFGSLAGDIDLKAIVKSLSIRSENGKVLVGLSAMGMDVTAAFKNGLNSITLPVDIIASNLVVQFSDVKKAYTEFSDNIDDYVSIDQVFDDYFGENNDGPIYNLVNTNSWLFEFKSDSEIDVLNDDGTTTKYQIVAGSYIAFYYLKGNEEQGRDAEFKIRANLTVQKDGGEFLYLDVAFIDGRIYATYDSRKWDIVNGKQTANTNELRATVSLDAIKETIELLPALIEVVPQIGDLMDSLSDAMSSMESKLTLGNISKILNSVSYGVVDGRNVFTLDINGQAIDANNFSDSIMLKVSNFGSVGLSLDQLTLSFGNVSVNIVDLVVTGSEKNEETGEFVYVEKYINSYLDTHGDVNNHMNLDSIRELLSSFIVTASDHDPDGSRHFNIQGTIHADALSIVNVDMPISIQVDITAENVVYIAVKLVREKIGTLSILKNAMFDDRGGDSYLYYDGSNGTFTVIRNSYRVTASFLGIPTKIEMINNDFVAKNVSTKDFTANIFDYLMEMVNFSDLIEDQIRGAIEEENTNVYGVEDILKDYSYSESNRMYNIEADLKPIDSMLGTLTLSITHGEDFSLTTLKGKISVVSGIIDLNITLNLKEAVAWQAKSYVENCTFWSF